MQYPNRRYGKKIRTFPESETLACYTLICCGNAGDPIGLFRVHLKSMVYKRYKARKPEAKGRESDGGIVLMKLGNADGGKASHQISPLIGTHLLHAEVGK